MFRCFLKTILQKPPLFCPWRFGYTALYVEFTWHTSLGESSLSSFKQFPFEVLCVLLCRFAHSNPRCSACSLCIQRFGATEVSRPWQMGRSLLSHNWLISNTCGPGEVWQFWKQEPHPIPSQTFCGDPSLGLELPSSPSSLRLRFHCDASGILHVAWPRNMLMEPGHENGQIESNLWPEYTIIYWSTTQSNLPTNQ